MINSGFEKIDPTPLYPSGTNSGSLAGLKWGSQANVVKAFKQGIKHSLRQAQQGRCCFCRRRLYDDYATHLEHFVDKDGYSDYTFEIRNLAICCGTCNIIKNGHFSTWTSRFNRLFTTPGQPSVQRCPVMNTQLGPGIVFPRNAADFRWVNPYVHIYSEHIRIAKGWIFLGTTTVGLRTIRGVKLNNLGIVETRALAERLGARGGRLSLLVGAMAELDSHRARDVASAVVAVIRRRRAKG